MSNGTSFGVPASPQRIADRANVLSSVNSDHNFPARFIRLHQAMRLLNFIQAKYFRRLRLIYIRGYAFNDRLERNIGERVVRQAIGKCACEKAEVNATRHMQQRVEGWDGIAAS